jgi:tellurite resistance protein TerB
MASFLEELKNSANSVTASVKAAAAKYKSQDFRDAILAICAMVAAADGSIDQSERDKVKRLIMSNEALSHFTPSELGKQFEAYIPKALDEFAVLDLEKIVGKLRGKADEADMAVKIALIIANADGVFADSEKAVVRTIIKKLALNASDYGL